MKINLTAETSATTWSNTLPSDRHCLVVINQREVRVFRSLDLGTIPEQIFHSLAVEAGNSAQNGVFARVAKALTEAAEILIFGSGEAGKNEMSQLVCWLEIHRLDLAKRIVRTVTVDARSMVDSLLLAKARIFYGLPQPASVTTP